jgi:O-antigen biosynthesis protein
MFNPLDYPVALASPQRLVHSAWIEHVPFGMAVVEMVRPSLLVELGVHLGVSYCSFCQAIDQLGLDTRVYGVDTWQGDEHAGFTEPVVLHDLKRHHDPLYGRFSYLVQSTFCEAANRFADGTIDLLHIDGFHSYAAVKEDFDTWRPKMSRRGVILMHDVRARLPGFGVWQLWDEIEATYPTFAFDHQYGLGVVAVGSDVPSELQPLLNASPIERGRIRRYFSQVGERLSSRLENLCLKHQVAELEAREVPPPVVLTPQAA